MDPATFPYFNLLFALAGLVLVALALAKLLASPLSDTQRLLWAILIIGAPVFGPVAFLIFNDRKNTSAKS